MHKASAVAAHLRFFFYLLLLLTAAVALTVGAPAWAACSPGQGARITSGDPSAGPPVILTGLGAAPSASFFLLGAGDNHNSGSLPASAWLVNVGDVDGDGLPDYRVEAPADGPGGWGDPRTNGCPAFASPAHPPLVLIIQHEREDLDADGRFDVFEDRNRNGQLDPGEDRDLDGHLTDACDGVLREDLDCDGHLDYINEDDNGNGRLDPGEDRDGDGHLDLGNEDRNRDFVLNDRPVVSTLDADQDENGRRGTYYPYGERVPSHGGILVISLAWNGTAYNLQSLNTPTELLGPVEDRDHDGAFDVFEDINHNGRLDPGEDRDGDGRLTPPGGCEGASREDIDCDGHLDDIDEDFNGNGRLDPGEDIDGDGRLDRGVEDRNRNQILDDRPFPSPSDDITPPPGSALDGLLPATYPYGRFLPLPLRLLRATTLDTVAITEGLPPITVPEILQVSGMHIDPQGDRRARIDVLGVPLNDNVGGTRGVFDHLRIEIEPPGLHRFTAIAETGAASITVPSAGNMAGGAFLSFLPAATGFADPSGPIDVRGLSAGSDAYLGAADAWPGLHLYQLLDSDGDHIAQPTDNCPDVANYPGFDADRNGIGDLCDAGGPTGTALDLWRPALPAGSSAPSPKPGMAAAFDATHRVVVLFGGAGADDRTTWELDGAAGHPFAGAGAPEARYGHRMVYDSARGRVVMYGGTRNLDGSVLSDQWDYDAATHAWTRQALSINPGPRSDFAFAYDSRRAALVLFGGSRSGRPTLGETWVYAGGAWKIVPSPRSPSSRTAPVAAYDAFHGVTVLAGGRNALNEQLNDVWEFDGATWQPVDYRGSLPPLDGLSAGFDPARRQMIVLGGSPPSAVRPYDGVAWSALPTLAPLPVLDPLVAAFDGERHVLVALGQAPPPRPPVEATFELVLTQDADADGVPDIADDCPLVADPDQLDTDGDGSGDLCDNCPLQSNPDQRDLDRDGAGDACDGDRDGDAVANAVDACPDAYVPGRNVAAILAGGGPDTDGDGIADDCDACPHDPVNDVDHDGRCGDTDNCPMAFNPMQLDTNNDGAGDACQPIVRIDSIASISRPFGALDAMVTLSDPDGNRLHGTISVAPAAIAPEVVTHGLDGCAHALLPDGVPGEGLAYADIPGTGRILADVDSNFGCADGLPDFTIAPGTCAGTTGQDGTTVFSFDRPLPFPICVRRIDAGGTALDLMVYRAGSDAAVLSSVSPAKVAVDYAKSHLPRFTRLDGLGAPGPYVLKLTASDDVTPTVSDEEIFDWHGEGVLYFNLPRRGQMAAPLLLPGRPPVPVR